MDELFFTLSYILTLVSVIAIVIWIITLSHNSKTIKRKSPPVPVERKQKTPSFSSGQWESRQRLLCAILHEARLSLPGCASSTRPDQSKDDLRKDFDRKANCFIDSVNTRSFVDIPPYFASVIGMNKLEIIVADHARELEDSGVHVMMGSSPLFMPSCKHIVINDEPKSIEID